MRKVIDGKFYDTERALQIHKTEVPPYDAIDPLGDDAIAGGSLVLYKSYNGQFFVISTTSFSGRPDEWNMDYGELLSEEKARDWLDQNNAPVDAYLHAGFMVVEG